MCASCALCALCALCAVCCVLCAACIIANTHVVFCYIKGFWIPRLTDTTQRSSHMDKQVLERHTPCRASSNAWSVMTC